MLAMAWARWGPAGHQNLQDPDKNFRIIAVRAATMPTNATKVKLSVFIDGLHASDQPPIYITGNTNSNTYSAADVGVTAPDIAQLMVGLRQWNNGSRPQFLSGDIPEVMVYDAALSNLELDRLGNYLSRKYALPYMRLDNSLTSPSRSVPVSCSSCISPGPVGEGGVLNDWGRGWFQR